MNDLHNIVPRLQTLLLQKLLQDHPVVILHGARQTGKTTLARIPSVGQGRAYRTLDDLDALDLARRDPTALFLGRERITLDEVQRQPDLLLAIKADVDRRRTPGRFLLTGSANLLLMEKVAESLTGRAVYLCLPPLTWAEVERRSFGRILDVLLERQSVEEALTGLDEASVNPVRPLPAAILAGGYPVPALSDDVSFRSRWFDGYVQTYLERDLRDLSATDRLIEFRRLMQMCAAHNGGVLNVASVAGDAGLSPATARRYLNLLEVSFQIARLPAYAVNRGKRLIKAPKIYWTDTGLAAHLSGIFAEETLVQSREWGTYLENWVGIHLLVYASLKSPRISVSYWRTSNGHEVDFVIEAGKRLMPVEVKATSRPSKEDLRGLNAFLETYPDAPFGVVACQCERPAALSSRALALPIAWLLLG
jgi:predicted AAA+ superfamily ATPase